MSLLNSLNQSLRRKYTGLKLSKNLSKDDLNPFLALFFEFKEKLPIIHKQIKIILNIVNEVCY